jgi:hypothetical protein
VHVTRIRPVVRPNTSLLNTTNTDGQLFQQMAEE